MHDLNHDDLCVLFHAGELAAERAAAFSAESARCADCRELLGALRGASRLARGAAAAPPAGLDDAVMARIRAETAGRPAPRRSAFALALALAALLLATVWRGVRRSAQENLRWASGLDGDIARTSEELGALSRRIQADEDSLEIDADITGLRKDAHDLDGRLRANGTL